MDRHPVDGPVDAEGLDPVDEPHFGRKRIPTAERDAEQRTQNGQVFRVERVLSGPELAHDLPLGEEDRLLRLLDDQLGIGAQIRMRETPGEDRFALLRRPTDKINDCHMRRDELRFTIGQI